MKYWFGLCFFMLLGCAHLPQAENFSHAEIRQYQITDPMGADSLVVGEYQEQGRWRWLQMNALGVPLARQIYQKGQWKNDGFLPPNNQARALFVAIMLADQFGEFPDIKRKMTGDKQTFFNHGKLWLEVNPTSKNRFLLKTAKNHWQMKKL